MSKRARSGPRAKPIAGREGLNKLDEGVLATFIRRPLKQSEAQELFQELKKQDWKRRMLTVWGKKARHEGPLASHRAAADALGAAAADTRLALTRPVRRRRSRVARCTRARAHR